MDVKFYKRLSLFVIGLYLLGLGISLTIQAASTLGIGAWDAINTRLNQLYPIFTIGNYLIIVAIFACLLAGLIFKEFPKIYYLITAFLLGYSVDLNLFLLNQFFSNVNHYVLFIFGLIVIAIATHIYLESNLMVSPLDYLMKSIMHRFQLNIGVAKIIVEVIAVVIALILQAPLSYGTIIIMFGLGPLYGLSEKPIKNLVQNYLK